MTAEEFLNRKIEEGAIPSYNKRHIIKIMEEYAELKDSEKYTEAKTPGTINGQVVNYEEFKQFIDKINK